MATIEDHIVNSNLGKRKRGTTEQVNGRAKFEEYLHVMLPPSKSKIWSNEDLARQPDVVHSTLDSPQLNTIGDHDSENCETVPKKFKNALRPQHDREVPNSSKEHCATATIVMPQSGVVSEAPSLLLDQELPATTDGDWLRSRTSNLVEVDRTEDAMLLNASLGTEGLAQESITAQQLPKNIVSDLSVQAETVPGSQILTPAISAGYATGRIFVRNLAYGSTEDDLREYFTSLELDSVQEVR